MTTQNADSQSAGTSPAVNSEKHGRAIEVTQAERMPYSLRHADGGAMEIVINGFVFIRINYDYRYTSNAHRHQVGREITEWLNGASEARDFQGEFISAAKELADFKDLAARLTSEQLFRAGDDPVAALGCAAENEARLRAEIDELKRKNSAYLTGIKDWCDEDTEIRAICAKFGIDTEGDSWGVPALVDCVEELAKKAANQKEAK